MSLNGNKSIPDYQAGKRAWKACLDYHEAFVISRCCQRPEQYMDGYIDAFRESEESKP